MSHDADYKNFNAELWRIGNKLASAKHYAASRQWDDAIDIMLTVESDSRDARILAKNALRRELSKPGRSNPRRRTTKRRKVAARSRRIIRRKSRKSRGRRR